MLIALWPLFALIALGVILARTDFPGHHFWPLAERLTYFLLLPALLVHRLATTPLHLQSLAPVALVLLSTLALASAFLCLFGYLGQHTRARWSSVYQGGVRFNTYLGLAGSAALYGVQGSSVAALIIAIQMPLVNVLSVLALQAGNGRALLRSVLLNPLILASLGGMVLNATGVGLPLLARETLDVLARAALPLGLLAVGAGLQAVHGHGRWSAIGLACLCKLLLMPLLTWTFCRLFATDPISTAVLVLFAATPGAPSAYILSRQLGGDAPLMAAILTVQTALAALTLPLMLQWLLPAT